MSSPVKKNTITPRRFPERTRDETGDPKDEALSDRDGHGVSSFRFEVSRRAS
jgi:hypothetical protein